MTLSQLDVLALTIYGEARGEPVEGKIAVGNVIRNRLRTNRWGASYESVCLAHLQFSCWSPAGGASNYAALQRLAANIMAGHPPIDPVLAELYWVAQGIQSGVCRDNVDNATFYYVTRSPMPAWAVGQSPVAVIESHSFFSGIR
ncbi:MAG TPA: cell wall hydrolase [Gaiellaceae bacterium]|nr:cell wall hydrolase [Gaiellaceae bacterium]